MLAWLLTLQPIQRAVHILHDDDVRILPLQQTFENEPTIGAAAAAMHM